MSYASYASSQQQQQRERGPQSHKTITNCANNGSGAIRVTAASHGYATNNKVDITGVIGTTEANGVGWTVTQIDANNFDLVGSTFSHAYVSGGLARLQ